MIIEKPGTDEWFETYVRYVANCRKNNEVIELLREVWDAGREHSKNEFETLQPEDKIENKNRKGIK